jgi:hypothetical protein
MSKFEGHKHDVPSNFGRKFDRVPPVIKVNYRKQKIKKLNHKGE